MELPKSLASNLAFSIYSIALQYRLMFDREMQPLGLTRSQWWLLTHLYYFNGASQAQLAEVLDIDKSAVARLVARLEKKGWVERRPHARDGRAMEVFLTGRIRQLMEDITTLSDLLIKQSLGRLGKARIKELHAGLAEISGSLDAMIDSPSAETMALRRRIQKDLKDLGNR